ncbi:UPF0481 protein At3g47200-like [Rosa rugosa]|uniref:UPF0481 protein At3g47200-like n=1 Tax=Rosa rugosa TaxID=74645 RepID=UPI002B410700|nr:UPF0481 protein At3g47200-like [Rosa rugosa]
MVHMYYMENIKVYGDDFARMITYDAIFLIELLLRGYYSELVSENNHFGRPYMILDIWHDLMLLENQVSFFLLHFLCPEFIITSNGMYQRPSMLFLAHHLFVRCGMNIEGDRQENVDLILYHQVEVKHLVDLLRRLLILPTMLSSPSSSSSLRTSLVPLMLY